VAAAKKNTSDDADEEHEEKPLSDPKKGQEKPAVAPKKEPDPEHHIRWRETIRFFVVLAIILTLALCGWWRLPAEQQEGGRGDAAASASASPSPTPSHAAAASAGSAP
jgi:hypothetical protein